MNINELIKKANTGDIEARNKVIEQHLYIIEMVTAKLCMADVDISTKKYGALMGIISAIKNFKEKRGEFPGYAYTCALKTAMRHMSKGWFIKTPIRVVQKQLKEDGAPEIFSLNAGDNPARDACSGIDKQYVEKYLSYKEDFESLDVKRMLKESLNQLTDFEKDAIYQKYDYTNTTLRDIGNKYGVSYEWVRLKQKEVFPKLQAIFNQKLNSQKKEI